MTLRALGCGLAFTGTVVIAAAGSVEAGGWSVNGVFSQNFTGDTNPDLSETDAQPALQSQTDLALSFSRRTERSEIVLTPGVRANLATDANVDQPVLPRFNGRMNFSGVRDSFGASLNFVPTFANDTQFDEGRRSEADVIQLTASAQASYGRRIDSTNQLSFIATARAIDFTTSTETLDPSQSFGLSMRHSYGLDGTTSLNWGPSATVFLRQGDSNSNGVTVNLTGGVSSAVNRRLSYAFSAGPSMTFSQNDANGSGDGFQFGVVGNASMSYATARNSFSLSAGQSVQQDDRTGDLENRLDLGLGLTHAVNATSRLSLNANLRVFAPLTGNDTVRTSVSIAPTYTVDLTSAWSVAAGYRFRALNDDGFENSNAIFMRFSRNLSLIP